MDIMDIRDIMDIIDIIDIMNINYFVHSALHVILLNYNIKPQGAAKNTHWVKKLQDYVRYLRGSTLMTEYPGGHCRDSRKLAANETLRSSGKSPLSIVTSTLKVPESSSTIK